MELLLWLIGGICLVVFLARLTRSEKKERYSLVRARENLILANGAPYRRKAIMNSEEAAVFGNICFAVEKEFGKPRLSIEGFFVFPQVSLGSFIWVQRDCDDKDWRCRVLGEREWQAAASGRPDFLITTYNLHPALTIEYHGGGRYALRRPEEREISDEIKEVVHQKIGVTLLKIKSGETAKDYCERVVTALNDYIENSKKHRSHEIN